MTRKPFVSAFLVVNLLTVALSNAPEPVAAALGQGAPALVRLPVLLNGLYGQATGLGNRWELFSALAHSRSEVFLFVEGADAVRRPLSTAYHPFYDIKEIKLSSNLLLSRPMREAYALWVARRQPADAAPVRAVVWEVRTREVFIGSEAATRGTHLGDERRVEERVPCAPPGGGR